MRQGSPSEGSTTKSTNPVVFGEVLFDRFPDGANVLGGAPFNVCWHLRGFGAEPLLITAVGSDAPGREVLRRMEEWGLSTAGTQVDDFHPTGRVMVHTSGNENRFEIGTEQAWDYIDPGAAQKAVTGPVPLLYHGTLALRADRSWHALQRLLGGEGPPPTFVDLNLRDPWWTQDRTRWCLSSAHWLKLNDAELADVTSLPTHDTGACRTAAVELANRYRIPRVIVTRGAADTLLVMDGETVLTSSPPAVDAVADTVGAGDAFSAVACLGVLRRWGPQLMLDRAVRFAADVCRLRGATTTERSLYERRLEEWS